MRIKEMVAGFLLMMVFVNVGAQDLSQVFSSNADSLGQVIFGDFEDDIRIQANEEFEIVLFDFLQNQESLHFVFDSIKFVKHLVPEDRSFAMISWVIPVSERKFAYSGFLQKLEGELVDTVYRLKPNADELQLDKSYGADNWSPAVYTYLLPKFKKTDYYTLLSWIGKPEGLAAKMIETLSFDSAGEPVFGKPVFTMKSGKDQCRVYFEYTDQLPFHLAYEKHRLPGEKKKAGYMIVFNRLGGNTPGMGRRFRAAVPSYEVYDAFVEIGGKWVLFENVDPRVDTRDLNDKPPAEIGLQPR